MIPKACAPYRARTKGKDERGVGYVKRNAIAGHRFVSLEALRAHLSYWIREVADPRVHGTIGEEPIRRFERAELCAAEVARKDERRIQMWMSIAKFPFARTLDGFAFDAQPSVEPKQIRKLAVARWVANGDSLL